MEPMGVRSTWLDFKIGRARQREAREEGKKGNACKDAIVSTKPLPSREPVAFFHAAVFVSSCNSPPQQTSLSDYYMC